MRSRKSDIVGRETTNFSFTTNPAGYEADLVFGDRLHHPFLSGVAFLIFLIIFNIITFPITAVLNALVMISDKAKSRLRALLAFLPLTDFTVGILVQSAFAAMLIMLLPDETRVYCVWQVVVSSLFHLCVCFLVFFLSAERYIAMTNPFFYITRVGHRGLLAHVVAYCIGVVPIPISDSASVSSLAKLWSCGVQQFSFVYLCR